MSGTVLILGGNGRFGRHAAEAFWNRSWRVVQFDRSSGDLATAARGADVIVNGWNPPYQRWAREVPGLTRSVIEAAGKAGATVILPGNVYPFGEGMPEVLDAFTPHAARNPLGHVRAEMELAYRESGVPTIVLRAGDFIDSEPSGNWFDRIMIQDIARGRFVYPGRPDIPHAWAWLPDVARAAVSLAARRNDLPTFADIPFEGYAATGKTIAGACKEATGRPVTLRRMSWLPIILSRPVWPMARHLLEMRYLWETPHRLSASGMDAHLPEFCPTPLPEAIRRAVLAQIDPDQPVPEYRPARGVRTGPQHATIGHSPVA